jgi:hypothetical protein
MTIRIGLVGVALLTAQENVERVAIGQAAPGPGILLSPEYPFGLWIAIAVSAVVALVATLFVRRERDLVARLRAARQLPERRRSTASPRLYPGLTHSPESLLGRCSGLRAPPVPTLTS